MCPKIEETMGCSFITGVPLNDLSDVSYVKNDQEFIKHHQNVTRLTEQ